MAAAVQGGVSVVQLREKNISSRDFYQMALSLKRLLAPTGVPLIINDRLDIVLAVEADGLHIGQSDLPYAVARELLGPDSIIGLSVENVEQARAANALDVDYIGLSPVFGTATKKDIAPPLGLEGVQQIQGFTKHRTVAIGGIKTDNAASLIQHGVDGLAVVSAIVSQESPMVAAAELRQLIDQTKDAM